MNNNEQAISELVKAYPTPRTDVDWMVRKLERMRQFYKTKAPIAPEAQGKMFEDFAYVLERTIDEVLCYHELTKKLAELK